MRRAHLVLHWRVDRMAMEMIVVDRLPSGPMTFLPGMIGSASDKVLEQHKKRILHGSEKKKYNSTWSSYVRTMVEPVDASFFNTSTQKKTLKKSYASTVRDVLRLPPDIFFCDKILLLALLMQTNRISSMLWRQKRVRKFPPFAVLLLFLACHAHNLAPESVCASVATTNRTI